MLTNQKQGSGNGESFNTRTPLLTIVSLSINVLNHLQNGVEVSVSGKANLREIWQLFNPSITENHYT